MEKSVMKQGVIGSIGLNQSELDELHKLELLCNQYEGLQMRLNWDMLNTRPRDQINDLLYYRNNQLVGYLGLYHFGPTMELTAMVHPEYRRKGIFKELWAKALEEIDRREIEKILIFCEEASSAAINAVKAIGGVYSHSEYKMECDIDAIEKYQGENVELIKATILDVGEMARQSVLYFGGDEKTDAQYLSENLEKDTYYSFIVKLEGQTIGKIHGLIEDGVGIVFGFGVLPEFRGKGYGREILREMLSIMADSGQLKRLLLEVACENRNALGLYQSCGFRETAVYNYYEIAKKSIDKDKKG